MRSATRSPRGVAVSRRIASTISTPAQPVRPPVAPGLLQGPGRAQPEAPRGGREEQRRGMGGADEARLGHQPLHLTARIGTAEAEGRGIRPRPEPAAAGHHHQRPALRREDAMHLVEQRQRMIRGLEPMHHHQPVDAVIGQGPAGLVTEDRVIGAVRGPVHHALRARHQPDDPLGRAQKRPEQRHRETIARQCQAPRVAPTLDHPVAHTLLRRTPQLAAVIEVAQDLHVEMH